IALILEAWHRGSPLRLAVSALTHHAIDNLLAKVHDLIHSGLVKNFPGRYLKWGQRLALAWEEGPDGPAPTQSRQGPEGRKSGHTDDPISTPTRSRQHLTLTYVDDAADILSAPYVILGATGFGLYQLFDSQAGALPAFFDWIVLDEASQMLLPQ